MDELLLIVEDDPSLREVIRLGLEGEGFRVVTAEDGPSALLAFAVSRPGSGAPRRHAARTGRLRGVPRDCGRSRWCPSSC